MNLFVITLLFASALADKLNNAYLPPASAHSAGGSGQILIAPHQHNYAINSGDAEYAKHSNPNPPQPPIPVLRYENNNDGSGVYAYAYATGNNINVQESNEIKNQGSRNAYNVVRGSYSYPGPNGVTYTVNYYADETGFHPSGAHLPTPPPIPAAILQSLEYNAAHPEEEQDESNQSGSSSSSSSSSSSGQEGYQQSALFVAQPSPQPIVSQPSGFVAQTGSHSIHSSLSGYAYSQSTQPPQQPPSGFVAQSQQSSSHSSQPYVPSFNPKSGYRY